jgi:Flp pilus assembly protein TadG
MKDSKRDYRRLIRRFRRGDSGLALVELALTMPILILMFVGAAQLTLAIYAGIEVANAARAATQYAAMNGGGSATYSTTANPTLDVTGMQTAANIDAANFTHVANGTCGQPVCFSTGYPTVSCACSNGVGTSYCNAGDCGTGVLSEETITVKTQVTYTTGMRLPGWGNSFTLYGYSQQMVLQ